MKNKKAKTFIHCFIENIKESKCKPNKLWVDQWREFYKSPMQKCLEGNDF